MAPGRALSLTGSSDAKAALSLFRSPARVAPRKGGPPSLPPGGCEVEREISPARTS